MLIPASAFVVWTMLQKSTAFDAVAPDMDEPLRFAIAVFAAVALGAGAAALSYKVTPDSGSPPPPTPPPK